MTGQQDRKPYKVSVVDRETGSARPRRTAAADTAATEVEDADVEAEVADSDVEESPGDAATTGPAPKAAKAGVAKPVPSGQGRASDTGWRHWPPRSLGRKGQLVLVGVAVLGIIGTALFGHAWASLNGQQSQQAQVRAVTQDFLLALTNFDAKNVDADFTRIQDYATGSFASQSNQFFGSTIRSQLEAALASSRGQIRSQFVQSINGNAASVYSVVDQTYVNNKMTSPSADELQIQTDLTMTSSGWKVSNVTVLNNTGSGGSSNGSSTSSTTTPSTTPSTTTPTTAAP